MIAFVYLKNQVLAIPLLSTDQFSETNNTEFISLFALCLLLY